MKKKPLFLFPVLLLISFLIAPMSHAASVGNPEVLGGLGKVAVGVEYDDSSRDLEFKNGRQTASWPGGSASESFPAPGNNITNMKLDTQSEFLVATVGLHEKVDVFAGIGVNRAKLDYTLNYTGGHENSEISDNSNTAWKMGVRIHLAEVAGVRLGGMIAYSAFDMNGAYKIDGSDLGSLLPPNGSYSTETKIHEWQGAVTASTHVWRLSPYAGVTYAKVKVENRTDIRIPSMMEDLPVSLHVEANAEQKNTTGVVVGTGVEIMSHLNANIEGRFINEDAVTASLSYTF
ncbi:hypothetical protein HY839_01425 [Candidatus Azambacteria bacterium]|nr:hypothetical protein [Candidatus Azambacteria bacterium]